MKKQTATGLFLLLSACAVGPDYERPTVETPEAFKEVGAWQHGSPQDAVDRGDWWYIYKDSTLDSLEKQVDISNQNLKAYEASYREALALSDEARSSLFPTVTGGASGTHNGAGSAGTASATTYGLSASGSWTVDVWGGIRRNLESSEASAQASEAQLASARLSAQATLATDYFDLRVQDELKRVLDASVKDDEKALELVQHQYEVGVAAKADVLTAETELETVKAQAINAGVKRAQLEHAVAVLIGKPPASFVLPPAPGTGYIPNVPAEVPSVILQRRPDIAVAERNVAAANAQIGVAEAAWFPDLTLSASYGTTATALSKILQASNSVWSFGPALAETVFDGGLREAKVAEATATYDSQVATYRQTVLTAFQQVEDDFSSLRILGEQAKAEKTVVADARKAEELTVNQYKEGIVPYSSVLTAEVTRLNDEQTELSVQGSRLDYSVALVEALGGGWTGLSVPQ